MCDLKSSAFNFSHKSLPIHQLMVSQFLELGKRLTTLTTWFIYCTSCCHRETCILKSFFQELGNALGINLYVVNSGNWVFVLTRYPCKCLILSVSPSSPSLGELLKNVYVDLICDALWYVVMSSMC